jgi:hypothetical protein
VSGAIEQHGLESDPDRATLLARARGNSAHGNAGAPGKAAARNSTSGNSVPAA